MSFLLPHRGRPLLSALLLWLLFLTLLFAGAVLFTQNLEGAVNRLVYGAIGTVAALLATAVLLRMNKSAWVDAGLRWDKYTGMRLLAGFAAGLALVGALLLLVFLSTGIRPVPTHGLGVATLFPLGALLPLALMEEIAFRGYPFVELHRRYGLWLAQVVTALAFAVYHILMGWPLAIALLGPGTWAFVFGIAAARSGGIALPTGIHFGLNVAQALVGLGTATASVTAFQLADANGLIGDTVGERTTPAGLAAQALFLGTALFLTYQLANRPAVAPRRPSKVLNTGRDESREF